MDMNTAITTFPDVSVTLRRCLVRICDGNHCAALLLDEMYATAIAWAYDIDPSHKNEWHTKSLETIEEDMCFLFNQEQIQHALTLLTHKGYISYQSLNTFIYYYVHFSCVDDALHTLREAMPKRQPVIHAHDDYQPPSRTREVHLDQMYRTEAARVAYQNRRAQDADLPATLTLEQWITTLEHFSWSCAYCGGEYRVIEHFIPLVHNEGGTTVGNCVPACNRCNGLKGTYHPYALPEKTHKKMGMKLAEVEKYLDLRGKESL